MSKKIVTLLFLLTFISMTSFGQSVREQIDKAAKDPKTAENAAKADVWLHRYNIGADSIQTAKTAQPLSTINKQKKKRCKKSSK